MTELEAGPDVPGAMQHVKSRVLPDGSMILFSQAPAGWLTLAGEPRRTDYRAYHLVDKDGARTRVPSVSTLLDSICPKPGLVNWSERKGIEGATRAVGLGEITTQTDPLDAVKIVRHLRLGADAAQIGRAHV